MGVVLSGNFLLMKVWRRAVLPTSEMVNGLLDSPSMMIFWGLFCMVSMS